MPVRVLAALAASLAMLSCNVPAAAVDVWGIRADQALSAVVQADDGRVYAFPYAFTAGAAALRHGWTDPTAQKYLWLVVADQRPNGG